ncbi:MAG TPA: hypothetical protein VNN73_11550 [Blastocatellia bacterium]|nr:hypothetical protein [Blastocatellia bacterium]
MKLSVLCAVAALIPSIIISMIVLGGLSSRMRAAAIEQIEKDARVAFAIYEKRLVEMNAAAARLATEIENRALASSDSEGAAAGARAQLENLVEHAQQDFSLDFITVADAQGKIIAQRPVVDDSLLRTEDNSPITKKIISTGAQPEASAIVERGDRYTRLGLGEFMRKAGGSTTDEALMIEAGAPIFISGKPGGAVIIGQMLNIYSNPRPRAGDDFLSSLQTPLVAEIRQALYSNATDDAGALVSLNNKIIASSIPASSGSTASDPSAVGATRDASASHQVITQGGRSYIVAWQPFKSIDGTAAGAIGVARPASELEGSVGSTRLLLLLIGAIITIAAGAAGFFYGRSLALRVDDLSEAANRWSVGELSAIARDRDPMMSRFIPSFIARDEISGLAERLEQMRESFRQAIERLRKR